MRIFLRTLGWIFAIGATLRGGLAIFTVWLAATRESVPWNISVESLFTDHVSFLNWAADFAKTLLPSHFVDGILGQPALVMIPLGAMAAALLAYACFRISRRRPE